MPGKYRFQKLTLPSQCYYKNLRILSCYLIEREDTAVDPPPLVALNNCVVNVVQGNNIRESGLGMNNGDCNLNCDGNLSSFGENLFSAMFPDQHSNYPYPILLTSISLKTHDFLGDMQKE